MASEDATVLSSEVLSFAGVDAHVRDESRWDDYDLNLIPAWDDHFVPDEETLRIIALADQKDRPLILTGPPGSGKSMAFRMYCSLVNQPLRRINGRGDIRERDLVGQRTLEYDEDTGEKVVRWVDGILTDAIRRGHAILLDEFDAFPAHIAMTLQAVLEPGHRLVLTGNGGELVEPPDAETFRIFATANTNGSGDMTGLYAGTNVLNNATLDRFLMWNLDYPSEDQEVSIVHEQTGLDMTRVKYLVNTARRTRIGQKAEACDVVITMRQVIAWADLLGTLSDILAPTEAIRTSYMMSIGCRLHEQDANYFADIIKREIGVDVQAEGGTP